MDLRNKITIMALTDITPYENNPRNNEEAVEKVLGNTSAIDEIFVKEYYNMKKENSYSQKQIADKRKSLEGVLVPITAKWNENLLKECGFRQIDCFWRCLNFAGWIAIK